MRFLTIGTLTALILLSTFATFHPATAKAATKQGTPSSASADVSRKTAEYLVKNQNGLVTVQQKDGPVVFAQVMSTSKLKIDLADGGKLGVLRITLRDEKNHKLWETKMGDANPSNFGFNWTYGDDKTSAVIHLSTTPREAVETDADAVNPKGTILVGGDGVPEFADIRADGGGLRIVRQGESFVMSRYEEGKLVDVGTVSMDKDHKTVTANVDGQKLSVTGSENSANLNSAGQAVKITKDGKSYTRVEVGDQHILLDGGNYKVNLVDGEIIVSPDTPAK